MSNGNNAFRGSGNAVTFELLEQREMFSVSLPALAALHPQSLRATPAAMVATKNLKVRAVQTAGTGLTGEYFSDTAFQHGYMIRTDTAVNLAGQKSDSATTQSQAVRWTGTVASAYTEAYSFSVVSNGGVRLWVNGQLLINQAQSKGGNLRGVAKIAMVAGQTCSIKLEFTRTSAAPVKVKLLWGSLHQKLGTVAQSAFFPDNTVSLPSTTAGLIGKYYSGKNFTQLVMQRIDPTIDFSFGAGSPTPQIAAGSSFSIRWTGQITPAYSETYTFQTTSDDGVRLYVDDQLIIDDFTIHSTKIDTAQITLVAGEKYDIRMDYFENTGVATAQLRWSSPSQPLQVVPASALGSTPDATAGTLTAVTTPAGNAVDLTWTGSPSATGYLIQESTDGGKTFTDVAATPANQLFYQVDGLDPDTGYSFRIVPQGDDRHFDPQQPGEDHHRNGKPRRGNLSTPLRHLGQSHLG